MLKFQLGTLVFIPLFGLITTYSPHAVSSLEDLALHPDSVSNCFKADNPFVYCMFEQKKAGWIVLDNEGNEPYQVYYFDNGPDYSESGLFRVRKGNKIGYADGTTGKIVIEPQYDCAYPFQADTARAGYGCTLQSDGEHSSWIGGNWITIDKTGKKLTN